MIRVLHVIGSLNYGGSQALVLSLLEHMDHEQVAFDFIIDHDQERQLEDRVRKNGSIIYCLPSFTGKNIAEFKKAWNLFFIEHPEYHIIHGHVRSTASIYLSIAKKHGLVTIAHSHSTNSGKGIQAIIKNMMQFFIRYIADYYFACSDEAGEWLFGKKAIQSRKYYLIPNGIDFESYKPNMKERELRRKELNFSDNIVFGHVGRFNEAKNHLFLIKVFKEIRAINPLAKLLLVGGFDNKEYPKVQEYVNSNNLQESVCFYGPSDKIQNILNAMDYFIFPSVWEGFGIAALEAQANGLPCFVSKTLPPSVKISDHFMFIDLNKTPEYWAKKILASKFERYSGAYDERFDVARIALNLQKLYVEMGDNNETFIRN